MSATAFIMPSRGTMSGMTVCRVTVSNARAIPTTPTSTNTCHTSRTSEETSARIAMAEAANPKRTARSSRSRRYRSTTMPYRGEKSVPVNLSAAYSPSRNGESVSCRMNHARTRNSICSEHETTESDSHR